jgi:hypothetical protein
LSGNVVYLLHGSPTQNFAQVGTLVKVGDAVYTSGGNGSLSSGYHLHLEVHSSKLQRFFVSPAPGDDINPEAWLQYQGPRAAMVSWSSPRIDLFIRGQDANIYHRYTSDDTNWAPGSNSNPQWEALGAGGSGAAGQPAAASWGANRLDIFAVGYEGNLWHKWWDGSGWGGWQNLAGGGQEQCIFNVQLIGTPSAAAWNGSYLSVFARGIDGTLNHCEWNGSSWIADPVADYLTGDPTVISPGGSRLDVFMLGDGRASRAGHSYHQWKTSSSGWTLEDWGNATNGSNFVSEPVASSYGSTSADAFATSTDGNLDYRHFDGSSWSGWLADGNAFGTPVIGGVGVADFSVRGYLSTSAFVRGADGHSYACIGSVGATCGWSATGGVISNDPAAISITVDEEDVIARGGPSGSAPFSVWHLQFVSDGWESWAPFSGVMA